MSTLVLSYGDLDDAADHAKKLASEIEDYADRLESKVSRKISSYSGDRTQNIYDADGFMRKKLEKLRQKKIDFSTLSSNLKTFESNCKTADKNVASAIKILSGDFKKAYGIKENIVLEFFNYLAVKVGNATAIGRAIKDGINVVKDFLKSTADKIKDWYKYQGGKYLVEAFLEFTEAILIAAVLLVSGAIIFAAGGEFIALVSVIMAITTMTNGHTAMNNDFAAYRAEKNGDASDAKRYSSRNTYAETLRKVSDSKLVHKFADGFEVVELTGNVILLFDCALNIGKGVVNLASKLFGKNSAPSSISEILSKVNSESQIWDDLAKTEDDAVKIGEGGSSSYSGGRTQKELDYLAKDPAHAGSTRADDINQGLLERKIGLDLEKSGELKGPITRDPTGKAEFIDANGQAWDVKSFNSNFKPSKGGYTLNNSMKSILKSLGENEYVILDTTNLKPEDKAELLHELYIQGLMDKIIVWP